MKQIAGNKKVTASKELPSMMGQCPSDVRAAVKMEVLGIRG